MQLLATMSLPDGEVALVMGARGDVAVGIERDWNPGASLVGRAGIVGVCTGASGRFGEPILELEPGLWGGPWDFAQASVAGNAALLDVACNALGPGPGVLLELYAGSGNFTRAFTANGWTAYPSDAVAPARALANFIVGPAEQVLDQFRVDMAGAETGRRESACDAIVLDPPREGAAAAVAGIIQCAPKMIVYVSCDPATLARDAGRLVEAGYRAERAWPIDLMPQTAHVEVVLRLTK